MLRCAPSVPAIPMASRPAGPAGSRQTGVIMKRMLPILALLVLAAAPEMAAAQAPCGRLETLAAAEGGPYRVSVGEPEGRPAAVLILLPGGGGFADLDDRGCPRALTGNSLIRSVPAFRTAGVATALVDAPAAYQGGEGLGGFRIEPGHAAALGGLVPVLRQRYSVPVWIVGTSRGAISAANAASRLDGDAAPDGVVLTSPVSAGGRGRLAWVAQSVFDLPLDRIRQPLLLVGHEADRCLRSPPASLATIAAAASGSARLQVVTVTGGPGSRFASAAVEACEGREPHGFAEQEAEVAAGIVRFVRGGRY